MSSDSQPQWLHPSSLLFVFAAGIRSQLIPAIAALFSASTGSWIGGLIAIVFFAGSMLVAVLSYMTLRYRLTDDELIVDEGVVFRTHRTVPVQRIQNVDSLQNPFHRLFGVAEVRIETASGTEPEAVLRVLSLADVESLRARLFARKYAFEQAALDGADALSGDVVAAELAVSGEPLSGELKLSNEIASQPYRVDRGVPSDHAMAAEPIVTLPLGLLVKAGLSSDRGTVLFFVGLGLLWQQLSSTRGMMRQRVTEVLRHLPERVEGVMWIWVVVVGLLGLFVLLKMLSIAWTVLRFYGYTLERSGEDLRVRCGLLTRVSATVRRDRIQLISVHRTLLGRWLKIASIRIETAGGGGLETEDPAATIARQWFLPVIQEERVANIIQQLSPGVLWNESALEWRSLSVWAVPRMRRRVIVLCAILGLASAVVGWITGVVGSFILLALGWWWAKRRALATRYARTEAGVLFRSGLLTRKCSLAFIEKIQSIQVVHSPFDRRWQMATLAVDTVAAGPAEHKVRIPMLDMTFARSERDVIATLASQAATNRIIQPVEGSLIAN